MKNTAKYLITLLFAVLLPVLGFAGGGWSGAEKGSIDRATPETHVWTVLAKTTGTGDVINMATITATDWATGDTISASSVTPPDGVRTLCFKYVEASGTDGRLKVRISGKDHFGRTVQSELSFTSSGTLITDAAFAPYPEPTFYVVSSTALNDADSIYCYSYGQGVYCNPQIANDLREFRINGTQQTYTTATNFVYTLTANTTAYFHTLFSSWNPATGSLPTSLLGSVLGATTSAVSEVVTVDKYRVWDAWATNLPGTAATDDLGLVTLGSTVATDWAAAVQTADMDNNDAVVPYYAAFEYVLPPNYVSAGAVTIVANSGMITTVADVSCTIDFEVFEYGAPTTDLCATAAQDINSLTPGNDTFTITATDLVAGDKIYGRMTIAGRDNTAAGVTIGRNNKLTITTVQNTTTTNTVAAAAAILQFTPNTTSYQRSTVVFGDGAGGNLLTESKSE